MSKPSRTQTAFESHQSEVVEISTMLGLSDSNTEWLKWPQRETSVSVPIRMDGGETRVLRGFRVQYSFAKGPTWGGLRWHSNESLDTVRALAAANTWRTAILDLPVGGAASGISCSPRELSEPERERLARGFVRSLRNQFGPDRDTLAPDLYTDPQVMAWILDEFECLEGASRHGVVTGKPFPLGGTSGRGDALAHGSVCAVEAASKALSVSLEGEPFVVCGFGFAGQAVARLACDILGMKLVGVSDTSMGLKASSGLDPRDLCMYMRSRGTLSDYEKAEEVDKEDVFGLGASVIFMALSDCALTPDAASKLECKIVCEMVEGGVIRSSDDRLKEREVFLIPESVGGAGRVVVPFFEQSQNRTLISWSPDAIRQQTREVVHRAVRDVYEIGQSLDTGMRRAALALGIQRVSEACHMRGWV